MVALLAQEIGRATTAQRALQLVHNSNQTNSLQPRHLAAACMRIAKLATRNPKHKLWAKRDPHRTQPIKTAVQNLAECLDPRNLSNIAFGIAKAGIATDHSWQPTWTCLQNRALNRMDDFNATDYMHLSWGFVKAHKYNKELFDAIAQGASAELPQFYAGDKTLTGLVAVFGEAQHVSPELAAVLERQLLPHVKRLNLVQQSIALRHFSRVAGSPTQIFQTLKPIMIKRLSSMSARDLAEVSLSVSISGEIAPDILCAIAREVLSRKEVLSPDYIACLATAFAKASRVVDERDAASNDLIWQLFRLFGEMTISQVNEFGPHEIVAISRAFVLGSELQRTVVDPLVFEPLANRALSIMHTFSPHELSQLAWAYARANIVAPDLFFAIGRESIGQLSEFYSIELVSLINSFGRMGVRELLGAERLKLLSIEIAKRRMQLTPSERRSVEFAFQCLECDDPWPHLGGGRQWLNAGSGGVDNG